MRNRTAIKWARNPLLAALLLVAFCIHALIPAGFMPGPGGLMICYGHITSTSAVAPDMPGMTGMDMAGMDDSGMTSAHSKVRSTGTGGTPEHDRPSVCPFAGGAASMSVCLLVVLLFTFALVRRAVFLPAETILRRGAIVPTRLPRGPPAIA